MGKRDSSASTQGPSANDPTAPIERRAGCSPFGEIPIPVLLVAYAPSGAAPVDRCALAGGFTVGRGDGASLQIMDANLSRVHFRLTSSPQGFAIEDGGSTNGTYLGGDRVKGRRSLEDRAVIRAGRELFVFHADGRKLLSLTREERFGIDGSFFAGPLVDELHEASQSSRHVLLSGPSGTGKERAAWALAQLSGTPGSPLPLLAHNTARFATEEEAAITLFGVAQRVFSNVDDRAGLIEQARGGFLLLDEVHSLPVRLQRSLLRVVEDGLTSRIGETRTRSADVRFLFASNIPGEACGLIPDLRARLRLVRIVALSERVADIPGLFCTLLSGALTQRGHDPAPVLAGLDTEHLERMCLDGFPNDNVRGLIDLADRIALKVDRGITPSEAIGAVFADRFGSAGATDGSNEAMEDIPTRYERLKPIILEAYNACGGNLSALERDLKARGIRCSWRWLSSYLRRWGVRGED